MNTTIAWLQERKPGAIVRAKIDYHLSWWNKANFSELLVYAAKARIIVEDNGTKGRFGSRKGTLTVTGESWRVLVFIKALFQILK